MFTRSASGADGHGATGKTKSNDALAENQKNLEKKKNSTIFYVYLNSSLSLSLPPSLSPLSFPLLPIPLSARNAAKTMVAKKKS